MRNFVISGLALLLCGMLAVSLSPGQTGAPSQPQGSPSATVSAAPASQIIPPPPNYHFPNGQTYVYTVEWHLFTAGNATVKLESAGTDERVSATADSSGVVNALYKVHDRFEALFSAHTFCSQRVTKHTEEGSHQRDTVIVFDYARGKSVLDEKNLKTGESKHVGNDIPACVTDVVSGFYYLASLPLETGDSYTFSLNDGGKTVEVTARVEARERVKVPLGTFQTIRVKAEATSGPMKGKGSVFVWFTDDPNRTPVQMRSKLGWGTLLFRMQRLEKQ
ncbi:MAG: DUF3108 domain-containing protein [Acidobacteriia bacterium]|nr:DUF3108 domain-containing protein [Terriglobia bacterium]